MKKRIFNVCNYYYGSKVYKNLFESLNQVGIPTDSIVVTSTKCNGLANEGKRIEKYKKLNSFTRLFYFYKLYCILSTLKSRVNLMKASKASFIHAHTLYSDGLAAFLLSYHLRKPLVITVRTTDVSLGFKFYIHYKWLARLALKYAKRVVFVSPAHKIKFQHYFGNDYDNKLCVIPNGVDGFYLENSCLQKVVNTSRIVALYVGAVNKNKNLESSINAFFNAHNAANAEFRVVGGTYKEYVSVYGTLPKDLVDKVKFLGRLDKESVLLQMRDASLFIMVSHSETFGLVYIEAISQCLPIVYSSGQGVDGYFKDGEFGFKANSKDVDSISEAILNTTTKFPNGLGTFDVNPVHSFSWKSIANIYKDEVYK